MSVVPSILAYTAGGLAFITSFPQLYQIITTKKVRDLNPYFFIIHSASDVLYIAYGVITEDYLLSYSVSMPALCNFIIFLLWIYYKDNNDN